MSFALFTPDQEARFLSLITEYSKATAVFPPKELPLRFESLRSSKRAKHPQVDELLPGIRVILFDIYGTLFSSAAGDISTETSSVSGEAPLDSIQADYKNVETFFRQAVLERHLAAYTETPYPEVRVEEIWETYPDKPKDMSAAEYALRYELVHNPVSPMPGARNCIRQLVQSGYELGIVSNAQFYTPLLFKAFWGAYPEELGFTRDFIAYSYIYRRAKPDPELFQKVLTEIQNKGYQIDECLYVGNDMLNDVFGAKNVGMRTALFAGDRKSLRIREDNPLCRDLLPDLVLDSLTDLPLCLSKNAVHE